MERNIPGACGERHLLLGKNGPWVVDVGHGEYTVACGHPVGDYGYCGRLIAVEDGVARAGACCADHLAGRAPKPVL